MRRKCRGNGHLLFAPQHAAFKFEISKSVVILCRLCQSHDICRCQSLLIAERKPRRGGFISITIRKARLVTGFGEKNIPENRPLASPFAFTERRRAKGIE